MAASLFDGSEKEARLINKLNALVDTVNEMISGGVTTTIDSTDSGGVYAALSGQVNGVNTTYIVSKVAYSPGTLKVWYRGQLQSGGEITETDPANGVFDVSFPPSGGVVMAEYY